MGLIGSLIVGLIAGVLGMLAVLRTTPNGAGQWIAAILIGVVGGWLGSLLMGLIGLTDANWIGSIVVGFIGASVIFLIMRKTGTGMASGHERSA